MAPILVDLTKAWSRYFDETHSEKDRIGEAILQLASRIISDATGEAPTEQQCRTGIVTNLETLLVQGFNEQA